MTQTLMIVPAGAGVGLTSATLGLVRLFNEKGIKVGFFQPIAQKHIFYERLQLDIDNAHLKPLSTKETETYLGDNKLDDLLEKIVEDYQSAAKDSDVVIVLGLVAIEDYPYAHALNANIAQALGADIILIAAPNVQTPSELEERIAITAKPYQRLTQRQVLGCVINKIGARLHDKASLNLATDNKRIDDEVKTIQKHFKQTKTIPILGYIPWDPYLTAPRVKELVSFISAEIIHEGDWEQRRVYHITLCARHVSHALEALRPGTLIITPADRSDIIIATAMAVLNGTKIAGLLLTGDYPIENSVLTLCQKAMDLGLPILTVPLNSFETAVKLQKIDLQIPPDDVERIEANKSHIAHAIGFKPFSDWLKAKHETRFSPPAFRYYLLENARAANQRIVLPEGEEPRTIIAADRCQDRGIAHCVLLGDPETIRQVAENEGIDLNPNIDIISPESIREKYVPGLVKLRAHKKVTQGQARDSLADNIVLGTMMLAEDDVQGLVAGAINTTANTIRPALQLVKTSKDAELVSSIFFMCLPNQVLVYGDCAVNPNPNASQLADIAIQSARTAKLFGLEPRVAMISYSTGDSGTGQAVEKIKEATQLVRSRAPTLLVDGPLQYDAAVNPDVAKKKAPKSKVAGRANVFIFPDLNTGNTTYKAVQRSSNALCVGPVLQGMNKPVNDLSRGASIDDIVYTIALTAIQAGKRTL